MDVQKVRIEVKSEVPAVISPRVKDKADEHIMNTCKVGKVDSLTGKVTAIVKKEAPYQNFFNIKQVQNETKKQVKDNTSPLSDIKEDKFITEAKTINKVEQESSLKKPEIKEIESSMKSEETAIKKVSTHKKYNEPTKRRHTENNTVNRSRRKHIDSSETLNMIVEIPAFNIKEIIDALQTNTSSIQEHIEHSLGHINTLATLINQPSKEPKVETLYSTSLYRIINKMLIPPITKITFHNRNSPNDYTVRFDVSMESETISK